jgi:hypothetical protein
MYADLLSSALAHRRVDNVLTIVNIFAAVSGLRFFEPIAELAQGQP